MNAPSAEGGRRRWLLYTMVTTLFWGVWGAFIELPEKAGFPATLGYAAWAVTMIPCAAFGLSRAGWKLDRTPRAVLLGSLVGLLGAGGQLLLFLALRSGPAYIVFPIISLYPVITVLLSVTLLGERAGRRAWTGIIIAIAAIAFLSYLPASGGPVSGAGWLVLAVVVFCCWGVQAYVMKFANRSMSAESIFFYMMVTGVALVPAALLMTDFSLPVEWGWRGSGVALLVQSLNAIGALTLVYAVRYGKAIIVVPMTSLAPVLTIVLSLMLYAVIPGPVLVAGMVLAVIAIVLLAE